MDAIFAVTGKDCVLMCTDTTVYRGIQSLTHTKDKFHVLGTSQLMLMEGDTADCKNFGEYVKRNIILQTLKQNRDMTTNAVANYTRSELAAAIRKGPKQTNVLIAGVDMNEGTPSPKLYTLDYFGSVCEVPFSGHGYAQYFVTSLMDTHWQPNMESGDLQKIIAYGMAEVRRRLMVQFPKFVVKEITKDGVRDVSDAVLKLYEGMEVDHNF